MVPVEQSEEDARQKRRQRIAHLRDELKRTDARIDLLRELHDRFAEELHTLEAEDERVNDMPTPRFVRRQAAGPRLTEEQVREVCVRLGSYTLRELYSVIGSGYSMNEVRRVHSGFLEKEHVRATGQKSFGWPMYEYVRPVEPGAGFEVQHGTREQAPTAQPAAGVEHKLSSQLDKPIRVVVRQAEREGWSLTTGEREGLYVLVQPGYEPVHFTTVNARSIQGVASSIEARVRNAKRNQQQPVANGRGQPVPFTGRPDGPAGKQGMDRRKQRAGRRVLTKKGKH